MAADAARRAGATHVRRLKLRVGEISGVVVEALELAFAAAAPGTAAECAELIVERVPVECECDQCGFGFHPSDVIYLCPRCGALSSRVRQGRELELASLEVD
jgi:hydrogenase nickel incorporation protein HypA/HybF